MKVSVYNEADDGTWLHVCDAADITECFPDDAEEAEFATSVILETGRYVGGGGAAALFMLMEAGS